MFWRDGGLCVVYMLSFFWPPGNESSLFQDVYTNESDARAASEGAELWERGKEEVEGDVGLIMGLRP